MQILLSRFYMGCLPHVFCDYSVLHGVWPKITGGSNEETAPAPHANFNIQILHGVISLDSISIGGETAPGR